MPFQVSFSRIINAPLSFAYAWCTDFRESDSKITGQKRRISILERNPQRIIMSVKYNSHARVMTAARIVTLKLSNAWHLDLIGDEHDETGDYRMSSLGPRKSRLHITFHIKYKNHLPPSKLVFLQNINRVWDKYVAALEKDYQSHRRRA